MSRAAGLPIWLALFVASGQAAPAPFLPKAGPGHVGAWSEPVAGIRVRLSASKARYRAGEPVHLTLEVQNVGKVPLMIEDPRLLPSVSAPGAMLFRHVRYPWAIIREGPSEKRRELDEMLMKRLHRRVQPGESLRVVAVAAGEPPREGEERLEKLVEAEPGEEVPRQTLAFPGGGRPGSSVLRAVFSAPARGWKAVDGAWAGDRLESPPIRIEVAD